MDRLALVVPCYNEEAVLEISAKELKSVLSDLIQKQKISSDSFILCVNDGSKDRTWELIEKEHRESEMVFGLKLAGNVGHQFALTAGLLTAKDICDIAVSIDADLQDDTSVIEEMVDKYTLANSYDEAFGGELSHIVVMQHVTKEAIDCFIRDLFKDY